MSFQEYSWYTAGIKAVNLNAVSAAYSDYLQTRAWDFMYTVTFRRPRKDPIYNREQVWRYLSPYSNRSFIVSEPHGSGFLHYHGLGELRFHLKMPAGDDFVVDTIQGELTRVFGWSVASPIRSMHEVAGYCSKYVSKALDDSRVDYDFLGDWNEKSV